MIGKRACAVALAGAAASAAPVAASADSGAEAWTAVFVSGPVAADGRLLVWLDSHARFREDTRDPGLSILRPALGWRAGDGLDLYVGYARVVSRPEGAADIEEDRLWQQAIFPLGEILGGAVTARTRLEQRFRPTGDDTGWRVRQFVRWERRYAGSDVSPVVWNEAFFALNDADWGQQGGFDQNRLFVGAAWRFAERVRIEGGYLNNRVNLAVGPGRTGHAVSASIFATF